MLDGIKWSKDIYVTKPVEADYKELGKTLRYADRCELRAIHATRAFKDLIQSSVYNSKEAYTLWDKDVIIAIFGIAEFGECGVPWLLASRTHRFMLKNARRVIANLGDKYPILFNYIYKHNLLHVKWVKKLGFHIYTSGKNNFHIFKMVTKAHV